MNVALEGQSAAYFKHASDAQLEWVSPVAEWMVDNADVRIAVGASTNTRELSGVPPERQTRRQAATGDADGAGDGAQRRGRVPLVLHALPDQRLRLRGGDEPGRLRGLLLRRLPGRRRRPADRLEAGLGGDRAAGRVDRGPRGGPGHRARHRHQARHRRPHVHPLRRRAQHARRRVLHRAGRGLGRGRGHLPPAGGDRRPRGLRRAPALRGRQGRRRRAPSAARSS